MCKEAIDAVYDSRRWGCRSTGPPRAASISAASAGTPRPRQGAGAPRLLRRRPHRPHDPADAVQNCVKHDVEFFNEFYALDIAITEAPGGPVATGVIAYELATGDIHIFHAKSIVFATGGSVGCTRPLPTRTH